MKNLIKHFVLLAVLIAGAGVMPADRATAQVLTTLLVFNPYAGYDPGNPYAGLIVSGNTLFGIAGGYGYTSYGAVFRLNTDGTGYVAYGLDYYTDGGGATDTPLLSSNTLYATSSYGGTYNNGTVFLMSTNGYDTNIYYFSATSGPAGTNSDGAQPYGGLVLSGNTLYGTTRLGGTAGNGSVFAVNTDGLGFTNMHNFSALSAPYYSGGTNLDGANPYDTLVVWSNELFGTTRYGGRAANGTIFRINMDGSSFTNLHNFTALVGITNGDGVNPEAGLIISGTTLYGTAASGGTNGSGTVFKLSTDGSGFAALHHFSYSEGTTPYASLILAGNTLYGTTYVGGAGGVGTVYKVNTDGSGFANLHSFAQVNGIMNSDGAYPSGNLAILGNTLYGTTQSGSSNGFGTVFSLPLGPQLAGVQSPNHVVFTWSTNQPAFTLQFTTNLATWSNVSNSTFIFNGQNIVTDSITGPQKYYRLAR
jgi:uncharacterized repeat protein (TIGR03803 family)